MSEKILICEDEKDIQELLAYNLKLEGYSTYCVSRGDQILSLIREIQPSLVLLDLMMPGLSGTEVCRLIRQDERYSKLPVIMVTAKDTEADRVVGLELGADDYITKPFSTKEVVARVRAVLRRARPGETTPPELGVLKSGEVKIDLKEHKAFVKTDELHLTLTEFKILKELLQVPGQVITRGRLGESRTVDVHLVALRKKMGQAGDLIETVRGVGYRFRNE